MIIVGSEKLLFFTFFLFSEIIKMWVDTSMLRV